MVGLAAVQQFRANVRDNVGIAFRFARRTAVMSASPATQNHSRFEDVQAFVIAALLMALGLALYRHAGLFTGGTAGMAFLLYYVTHWNFGLLYFLINLPFVWLAVRALGWTFTLKTFTAIGLVSVLSEWVPHWVSFSHLEPTFAAVMGGFLMGTALLMLFRHKASLGGIGVLAFHLQQGRGWRAGKVQMAVDLCIMVAALPFIPLDRVLLSVVGAVSLNLILAVNHKPGRYIGV